LEEKACKKCNAVKPLTEFNDTVILTKRSDCKTCQSAYTTAYYFANKQRIRNNAKLRRNRAKNFKK
jgi:hypothetical protein